MDGWMDGWIILAINTCSHSVDSSVIELCWFVGACSQTTLFEGPRYSVENGSLSFLCTYNGSVAAWDGVQVGLTFDGVLRSVYQTYEAPTSVDSVEFTFSGEDLRGHFGKRVSTQIYDTIGAYAHKLLPSHCRVDVRKCFFAERVLKP